MFSGPLASRAGSGIQRGIGVGITSGSAPRRAVLSIAVALVMAAGGAQATMTLSIGDSDFGSALMAGSGVSYWTDYSENCQNVVGGNVCSLGGVGGVPAANPSSMLFSWGTATDTSVNSILEVTYTGAGAALTSITLGGSQSGLGPAGGPTPSMGGPYVPPTGAGSMVAYEQASSGGTNNALFNHNASEQRVNIAIGGTPVRSNQLVIDGLVADQDSPYYELPAGATSLAIVQYDFTTQFDFATPIELSTNDVIEFRFYESDWDNSNIGDSTSQRFPDAYYGPMEVTFAGEPAATSELAVTPNPSLDFGNLRAGDGGPATGSLTAENVGSNTITGSFEAPTGDTTQIGFTDPSGAGFGLGAGATHPRDYSFDASDVALGLSDTGAQTFSLTQDVTSDADINPDATRTVTGSAVGPVLGVSLDATDPLDPAQNFAYDATIPLGDIAVDGGALTRSLVLANLFGTDLADLTTLSIFNIGLIGDDAALFSIVGAGSPGSLLAQKDSELMIAFDPDELGSFSTTLYFETDMNNPFGVPGTCSSTGSDIGNGCLEFTLTGSGTPSAAPVPGSLLLFMAGALVYPLFGRSRYAR